MRRDRRPTTHSSARFGKWGKQNARTPDLSRGQADGNRRRVVPRASSHFIDRAHTPSASRSSSGSPSPHAYLDAPEAGIVGRPVSASIPTAWSNNDGQSACEKPTILGIAKTLRLYTTDNGRRDASPGPRRHDAVPQREEHQLEGGFASVAGPLARHWSSRDGGHQIYSPEDWCRRSWRGVQPDHRGKAPAWPRVCGTAYSASRRL